MGSTQRTWGLLAVLSTLNKMKCFVVLSAVVACGFAAPVAEADAQILAGTYGHGLVGGAYGAGLGGVYGAGLGGVYGVGLGYGAGLGGVYGAGLGGVVAAGHAIAAPAVATYAHAASVAAYAHTAPVAAYAHVAPVAIATAPVVQHVGYNVHHQVHHVPQVSVQKHVS